LLQHLRAEPRGQRLIVPGGQADHGVIEPWRSPLVPLVGAEGQEQQVAAARRRRPAAEDEAGKLATEEDVCRATCGWCLSTGCRPMARGQPPA
jgi:hypothetical protein